MLTTFSEYYLRSKTALFEGRGAYGIDHLEKVDLETFVDFVSHLNQLVVVQKLDGANLQAGLDEDGRLYASRLGGQRSFKPGDFPKTPTYDGFRAALALLIANKDIVSRHLKPGEAINLEVLRGPQPNTVWYGSQNISYLAILGVAPGDVSAPSSATLKELAEDLVNLETTEVKTLQFDSTDGFTLISAPQVSSWKFTKSDPVVGLTELNFSHELDKLSRLMDAKNEVASSLGKTMTNRGVLSSRALKLADEKRSLLATIETTIKAPIIDRLVKLVRDQRPSIQEGNLDGAFHGIEGIILTNTSNGRQVKVVDPEFSAANKFIYQVRNRVSCQVTSLDPEADLIDKGGIIGQARVRSINIFGLDNAALPSQTKKVLSKLRGTDRQGTVNNLISTLSQLNDQAVRRKVQSIYVSALEELDDELDQFKNTYSELELKLDHAGVIKYTPEVVNRTLKYFADARVRLTDTLSKLQRAKGLEGLVEVFFSHQIDKLHSGDL